MAKFEEFKQYLIPKVDVDMYVLGAQGEKFTRLLPQICEMENKNIDLVDNILTLLHSRLKEYNIEALHAFDCSGLFMKFAIENNIFKYDMKADGIYKAIPDKIKVSQVRAGDFLWQGTDENKTHIGYAIDSEWAIEARGTKYGVVKTKISERGWKYAARPAFWEDINPKPIDALSRELYYNPEKMMRGNDVMMVQEHLNERGYSCGEADGIFGKKTDIAVRNFQSDKGLTVDGIVGKNTALALGFAWEG